MNSIEKKRNKIFIANRGGIGDVVLSLPVLKALKENSPKNYLSVMISPDAQPLLKGLSFVDEVISFDKHTQSTFNIVKKLWGYDAAIMFDLRYRSALISFLSNIPIRAGFKERRSFYLNRSLDEKKVEIDKIYETNNFASIVKAATGIDITAEKIDKLIFPTINEDEILLTNKLLKENGIECETPYLVVAPTSSQLKKDWPPYLLQQVFNKIKAHYSYEIILVGGAPMKNFEFKEVIDLMGKTTLTQTAEIMRRAKLYIGPCCANTHIAAAVNIPIIGLYGPTSTERWAPKHNTIALSQNPECLCWKKEKICFGNYGACMENITVDSVFDAFVTIVGASQLVKERAF